jgi:hypothetical protein
MCRDAVYVLMVLKKHGTNTHTQIHKHRREANKQKCRKKNCFENEPSNMKSTNNTTRSHIPAIFGFFYAQLTEQIDSYVLSGRDK